MLGYWNNKEETEKVLIDGGFIQEILEYSKIIF